MKPLKFIRHLLVLLLMAQGLSVEAQHYVPINGELDTLMVLPKLGGDSVYWVNESLTVVEGGTLRVEGGVKMYFAHASVGWDNNARFPAGTVRPAAMNSTPEKFEKVLRRAKDWCDKNTPEGTPKLITINAWNEWTEGSYLEPDTHFKFGYLEAIKRVFGAK